MKWVVGGSFIAVGLWLLLPDKDEDPDGKWLKYGAFTATVVLFFLAEIGDKTQIATVLLAAKYQSILFVVVGSIAGLMIASVPAVYLGENADAQNSGQSSAHCCVYLVLPAGYFDPAWRWYCVEGRLKCGTLFLNTKTLWSSNKPVGCRCTANRKGMFV